MAKIRIKRAYIEPHDKNEDNFAITLEIKDGKDLILVGKINLDNPKPWLYTMNNEDNDLVINNSTGMEANKWDYITKEILGG
jgi:hypothetical protein